MNLATIDWTDASENLNSKGFVHLNGLLNTDDCESLKALYADGQKFRSVINMQRYRFGKGEYKYFNYPLPSILQAAREQLYEKLAPIANAWMRNLNINVEYPARHNEFIEVCRSKNQLRPTPLILRYEKDGFNTLHQDLYGEIYFPFQVVFVLTQKDVEHSGGELVFVEQIPRAQSRAEIVAPDLGDAIIFTTNFRPVKGTRGFYRANMKHGVSTVREGVRFAVGVIFHDAA